MVSGGGTHGERRAIIRFPPGVPPTAPPGVPQPPLQVPSPPRVPLFRSLGSGNLLRAASVLRWVRKRCIRILYSARLLPLGLRCPAVYAPPTAYAPPDGYGPAPGGSVPVVPSPPPAPSVVQYPHGWYELRGDGIATPYTWVWIPNPPPPPPAPRGESGRTANLEQAGAGGSQAAVSVDRRAGRDALHGSVGGRATTSPGSCTADPAILSRPRPRADHSPLTRRVLRLRDSADGLTRDPSRWHALVQAVSAVRRERLTGARDGAEVERDERARRRSPGGVNFSGGHHMEQTPPGS